MIAHVQVLSRIHKWNGCKLYSLGKLKWNEHGHEFNSYCYFRRLFISLLSPPHHRSVSLLFVRVHFKQFGFHFLFQMTWKRMQERVARFIGNRLECRWYKYIQSYVSSLSRSLGFQCYDHYIKCEIYNLKKRLHFIQFEWKMEKPAAAANSREFLFNLREGNTSHICMACGTNKAILLILVIAHEGMWESIESSSVFNYNCTMFNWCMESYSTSSFAKLHCVQLLPFVGVVGMSSSPWEPHPQRFHRLRWACVCKCCMYGLKQSWNLHSKNKIHLNPADIFTPSSFHSSWVHVLFFLREREFNRILSCLKLFVLFRLPPLLHSYSTNTNLPTDRSPSPPLSLCVCVQKCARDSLIEQKQYITCIHLHSTPLLLFSAHSPNLFGVKCLRTLIQSLSTKTTFCCMIRF